MCQAAQASAYICHPHRIASLTQWPDFEGVSLLADTERIEVTLKSWCIEFKLKSHKVGVPKDVNWHPSESVFTDQVSPRRTKSHGVNAFLIGLDPVVLAGHHFRDTPPHFARSPRDATKCVPLAEDEGLLGASATVSSSGCGPVGSGCAAC